MASAGVARTLPAGVELSAQAVFRAVGNAGRPTPGLPFDDATSTVPHLAGRVNGAGQPGTYVAGWIKCGPTGVIGTNKSDAAETVRTVLDDAATLTDPPEPSPEAALATLDRRGVRYVLWTSWLRLDEYEIAAGKEKGRPRLKVCTIDRMLDVGSDRPA